MDIFDIFDNFTDGVGIDPDFISEEKLPSDEEPEKEDGGYPTGGYDRGSNKSTGDWGP